MFQPSREDGLPPSGGGRYDAEEEDEDDAWDEEAEVDRRAGYKYVRTSGRLWVRADKMRNCWHCKGEYSHVTACISPARQRHHAARWHEERKGKDKGKGKRRWRGAKSEVDRQRQRANQDCDRPCLRGTPTLAHARSSPIGGATHRQRVLTYPCRRVLFHSYDSPGTGKRGATGAKRR